LDLPVTVAVGPLPDDVIAEALDRGAAEARRLRLCGLIGGAALSLFGQWRIDVQQELDMGKRISPSRGGNSTDLPDGKSHLKEQAATLKALRAALRDGEASGPAAPFDFDTFIASKHRGGGGQR
jgi:hypothetical protein